MNSISKKIKNPLKSEISDSINRKTPWLSLILLILLVIFSLLGFMNFSDSNNSKLFSHTAGGGEPSWDLIDLNGMCFWIMLGVQGKWN